MNPLHFVNRTVLRKSYFSKVTFSRLLNCHQILSRASPLSISARYLSVVTPPGTGAINLPNDKYSDSSNDSGESKSDRSFAEDSETNVLVDQLFRATLEQVPIHGWSHTAVESACNAESIPIGIKSILMPNGPFDLVTRFYAQSNADLSSQMSEWRAGSIEQSSQAHPPTFASFSNPNEADEFLHRAIQARLRMLVPLKSHWPQAMALMALPQNAPTALGLLAELVDEIWAHAGDKSTDMNWYAKRLGLAYVHNLTEIHLLQDNSPDHEETWHFLQRRIEDLRACKQADLKSVASMVKEGVRAFGNVTTNLFGLKRH